jgi:hypothetical protein
LLSGSRQIKGVNEVRPLACRGGLLGEGRQLGRYVGKLRNTRLNLCLLRSLQRTLGFNEGRIGELAKGTRRLPLLLLLNISNLDIGLSGRLTDTLDLGPRLRSFFIRALGFFKATLPL